MQDPKRVLTISYSQSGQIDRILDSICEPMRSAGVEVTRATIQLKRPYPFPWPLAQFFNVFPETVYEDGPEVSLHAPEDVELDAKNFDLVIIGYQVWFLAPSLPVSSFLRTKEAENVLSGRRVITVIGCRNMWLMAQERMKARLNRLGAVLIDNIALTDRGNSAMTFLSTPIWVLTGHRGPWLNGIVPRAGVPDADIKKAARFGRAISEAVLEREAEDRTPMLTGLGAVRINDKLIQSEKAGTRSFAIWGKFLRWIGPPQSGLRQLVLCFFVLFLIVLILTVVPIVAIAKVVFRPFMRKRIEAERAYYSQPSGE